MARTETISRESLFEAAIGELRASITKPNLTAFKAYPKQQEILDCQLPGRYVTGGNRAGKTTIEVVDALYTATDTHPFRPRPQSWGHGAVKIRFVVVDIIKGVYEIILPELKRWCPKSALIDGDWSKSWDDKMLKLTLKNGSTISFVTHGMDLDKHGGVSLHAVYFDEEPPQDIFNENMMRLIEYDGFWLVAATAVGGITWTFDHIIEKVREHLDGMDEHTAVFELSQYDNPHLAGDRDSRNRFFIGMSNEDREIREEGKVVARSGPVFPLFTTNPNLFILDEHRMPPRGSTIYSSVDFGWSNATAWLWHAVLPDGRLYTFAEHYASKMTVPEHAAVVLAREARWGFSPMVRVGDPAGKQNYGTTGTSYITEYAVRGVYISVENIPHDVGIGIEKMQQYLRPREDSPWGKGMPTWRVSPNCANLIREMKKLRFAQAESQKVAYRSNPKEEIHKKDDHSPDSLRYFMTQMPDLPGFTMDEARQAHENRIPKTIPFDEMLARLADDPDVEFVYDDVQTADWEQGDLFYE